MLCHHCPTQVKVRVVSFQLWDNGMWSVPCGFVCNCIVVVSSHSLPTPNFGVSCPRLPLPQPSPPRNQHVCLIREVSLMPSFSNNSYISLTQGTLLPLRVSYRSDELLTKILLFAAESAAEDALSLHASEHTETPAASVPDNATTGVQQNHEVGSGSLLEYRTARNISDFRKSASQAIRAARAVGDQRGLDPHDAETIILRLAKGWICQPKSGSGGVTGDRDIGVFVGAGGRGAGDGESVFVKDAREVRWRRVWDGVLWTR